jgi:hypothetical protein
MAGCRNPFRARRYWTRQRKIEDFNPLPDSVSLADGDNSTVARHVDLFHNGLNTQDAYREWQRKMLLNHRKEAAGLFFVTVSIDDGFLDQRL